MKLFFKKAWIFIKTYWYIFVIMIVGIFIIIFGKNKDIKKIFKLINQERDLSKKEIKIVEDAHKKESEGIDSNVDDYLDNKKELDDKFESDKDDLDKKKDKASSDLVDDIKENPSKILSRIAEEMGWDYGR